MVGDSKPSHEVTFEKADTTSQRREKRRERNERHENAAGTKTNASSAPRRLERRDAPCSGCDARAHLRNLTRGLCLDDAIAGWTIPDEADDSSGTDPTSTISMG